MSSDITDSMGHLPECSAYKDPRILRPALCICFAIRSCEQRVWQQMLARIEDRMTDTDMDDLVSDDGKDYFWAAIRALGVNP